MDAFVHKLRGALRGSEWVEEAMQVTIRGLQDALMRVLDELATERYDQRGGQWLDDLENQCLTHAKNLEISDEVPLDLQPMCTELILKMIKTAFDEISMDLLPPDLPLPPPEPEDDGE